MNLSNMENKNKWQEDVVVRITRDTRQKLKVKAVLQALTLKDYLAKIANEKTITSK